MTENQAEKLARFASSVDFEVEEKIKKIRQDSLSEKTKLLKQTEDKALSEAYTRIQRAVRETEGKYRRITALKEQELRTEALKHREALSKKIFEAVEKKLSDFTKSDKYKAFLENQLKNEDVSGAVIKISERDEGYADMLHRLSGCPVETEKDIRLGGIEIFFPDRGIIIDKTLDSAFDEQKNSFTAKHSFKISSPEAAGGN
ncbi:MAG: V-type ATP synthase subunit E [Porcipelethomonas sp.]